MTLSEIAEPAEGGEAYIPFAPGARTRSSAILAEITRRSTPEEN